MNDNNRFCNSLLMTIQYAVIFHIMSLMLILYLFCIFGFSYIANLPYVVWKVSIVPEMKKIETKRLVLEQMCNDIGSITTSNNNQKQTLLVYKKYFLLCQSCSWHVSYNDLSGKLGNISGEEHVRCPICKIGRIITENQSDV